MNADIRRFGGGFTLAAVTLALVLVLAGCARTSAVEAGHRADSLDPKTDPPGRIEFEGRNAFRTVGHTFERWSFVRVDLEEGGGVGLSGEIEVEIDVASVETGSEWLNRRARSVKFLDAERYPTARLWIANVRPAQGAEEADGENPWVRVGRRYRAEMVLELHGVRQKGEIGFEVVKEVPLVVAGEVMLSRAAFGVGGKYRRWNPFSIRDEVLVRFEARIPEGEATRRRAEDEN